MQELCHKMIMNRLELEVEINVLTKKAVQKDSFLYINILKY